VDDAEMFDLIRAGLTSNWVSTIFEDSDGNIWAGTWGGGIAVISPGGAMKLFSDRNGLHGTKIWTIMQDREENILIGTNDHGLCVYKGDYFVNYFEEDGLINSQVWSILQASDGRYWFGTNEGISVMEPAGTGSQIRDFQN
jgi:ligand-binding sensor domain-containing protein